MMKNKKKLIITSIIFLALGGAALGVASANHFGFGSGSSHSQAMVGCHLFLGICI